MALGQSLLLQVEYGARKAAILPAQLGCGKSPSRICKVAVSVWHAWISYIGDRGFTPREILRTEFLYREEHLLY